MTVFMQNTRMVGEKIFVESRKWKGVKSQFSLNAKKKRIKVKVKFTATALIGR